MKKIKFRGYDTRDGVREMVTFTLDELLAGTDEYELVDPDSIAQFLGYDKNREEIYSDDEIKIYRYTLDGKGVCTQKKNAEDFFRISDIGKVFDNVELVEV